MRYLAYFTIAYGLLLLVGGMYGYAQAHSLPSLIMGSVSAALIIFGSIAMLKQSFAGYLITTLVTGLLTAFFAYRFIHSYKFMPPGMLAIISLIIFIILIMTKVKS